jgi:hypothetical protein
MTKHYLLFTIVHEFNPKIITSFNKEQLFPQNKIYDFLTNTMFKELFCLFNDNVCRIVQKRAVTNYWIYDLILSFKQQQYLLIYVT